MAFNIDVTSTFISESESYDWYNSAGASLKDVKTYIFFTSIWVDVSAFVKSIRISGSVNNLSGEPGANAAFVELDNIDKRFTDLNTVSPYYGNLSPNKQVKLELTISGETVTIFMGRVSQSGFVEQRIGHEGIVTIDVLDESDNLARKKFDKDYFYQDKKLVDNADAANSLLNILLETHGGLQHSLIVTNGIVACTMPYTVFKEGDSILDVIREIARASLVQYAGFRYDGKYIFESRLVAGWSEPSSEYVLTAESHSTDLSKNIIPLIGNRVKVRGVNDFVKTNAVLWELVKVRPVGTYASFPDYCWETVGSGEFYLGTPTDPYWMQYESVFGDLLYVRSAAITQKVIRGFPHQDALPLVTTGTSLMAEVIRGSLVLQNSGATDAHVMNITVRGTAVIRHKLSHRGVLMNRQGGVPQGGGYQIEQVIPLGATDDDKEWGLLGIDSNASSISQYGQTDLIISSEYINSKTQLDNILQWNLLNGKDPKHLFAMNNLPFLSFIQPGAPIWLNLTDLGYSGMATISAFEHNITPDGADTALTILENPGDWIVSTGATIRYMIRAPGGGTGEGEIGAVNTHGNLRYYVGAAGCSLPVDIMCDGVGDHEEWNEAINTVYERGGGTVVGVGGTFITSAAISILTNTAIELDTGSEIVAGSAHVAIQAIGTSTTHLTNIAILGKGTITHSSSPSSVVDLIHFDYVDDFDLKNIILDSSYDDGIYLENCTKGRIGDGMKMDGCLGTGLKLVASTAIIAASLTVTSCGTGCEMWPSLTTEMIDRGDCESAVTPAMTGEISVTLNDATWSQSSTVAHTGSFSYKYIDTALPGFVAEIAFADNKDTNDLHGTTAGKAYVLDCWLYIPSGQGDASEIEFNIMQYYNSIWNDTYTYAVNPKPIYDSWQRINMLDVLNASVTGFYIRMQTGFAQNEYCYLDDIHLYEFDETDSGCQLVNNIVSGCDDAIIIANSHALIQNNQIFGNNSTGITVAAGYRNIVMGNRAYNNGADVGLDNTNQDNFRDNGIDTQF